jgi:hypothetical protein
VTFFASSFLMKVDKASAFPVIGGMAYVLLGRSTGLFHPNRVIAISNVHSPRIDWDSSDLNDDPYFTVFGWNGLHASSDGAQGYTVAVRGCAPHECADGKIGFALFSSLDHATYRAHVSTESTATIRQNGDETYGIDHYEIKYFPKQGMPAKYFHAINGLICADRGFSKPSLLPLKCGIASTSG